MNIAHGMGNLLLVALKEKGIGILAMKAFIGNFRSFRFAAEHLDSCNGEPDMELLRGKPELVRGKEFFPV